MKRQWRAALCRVGFAICLSWLASASAEGQNDDPQPLPGGTQQSAVYLVASSDSQFDDLLRQHMPSLLSSPQYPSIRSTSVILVNNVRAIIRAITIKWTVIKQDGTQSVLYSSIFPDRDASTVPGLKVVIPSGGIAIITPLAFEIHALNVPNLTSGQRLARAYSDTDFRKSLGNVRSLHATIDGIVFGNGIFSGRDEFGLAIKYMCERRAATEEARLVLGILENGGPAEETLDKDRLSSPSLKPDQYGCTEARARTAYRLRVFPQNHDVHAFTTLLSRMAEDPVPDLKRESGELIDVRPTRSRE